MAVAFALIFGGYSMLPARFKLVDDWGEAATYVVFSSVAIACFFRELVGKLSFWVALLISSTIHALVVHSWILHVRTGTFWKHHGNVKASVFLGFILFGAVYGGWAILRQKFYPARFATNS